MKRNHDENGVSGKGWVCVGGIYPSGRTITEWTTEKQNSNGFYSSFGDFLAIHVFSHLNNHTEIWTEAWEPINGPRHYSSLDGLMRQQQQFEQGIVGTDGSLESFNTPEFAVTRGIIGEGQETLEAIESGDLEAAKVEAVDVLIFLCTLFNHLNMTPDEVEQLARIKMDINFKKYAPENFQGRTIQEGIIYSREQHKH